MGKLHHHVEELLHAPHASFWMSKAWLTEIPCSKLFTAAVSTRQGVKLGILVLLPILPEMVKAELPGPHIG